LAKIGKTTVPQLRALLAHSDVNMRLAALDTLGRMGRDASAALLDINKMIRNDSSEEVRAAAIKASQQIQKRD
jgi:HEAT repeat protein